MKIMKHFTNLLGFILIFIAGCASETPLSSVEQPDELVPFIDIDRFDRQLSQSLASPLSQISVPLLERLPPNQLPDRLKVWLKAVEKSGGKLLVQDPPHELSSEPKNPFLIFTLLNTLDDKRSIKTVYEGKSLLMPAKEHHVKVFLTYNASNEVVVEKVVFVKK